MRIKARLNTCKQIAASAVLLCLSVQGYALTSISENEMASITGKDGIQINVSMKQANVGSVSWKDGSAGSLAMKDIAINHPNDASKKVTTNIQVQTAADAQGNPGLKVALGLGKAKIVIPKLQLCDANVANCQSLGGLAVTNKGANTKFTLITSKGLFNENGTARLKAVIDNMSLGLQQTNGGTKNQLILGNMYANLTADGKLFVTDTEGLKFTGTINFQEKTLADGSNCQGCAGLEVLVQHQKENNAISTLGKIALRGSIQDIDLALRGVKDTATVQSLGFQNGSNGIAMRMSANFGDDFKLRIGGAQNFKGAEFFKWKKLGDTSKSFDTGNVYLNLVASDAGQIQTLTKNPRLGLTDTQIQDSKNWQIAQVNANTGNTFKTEGLAPSIDVTNKEFATVGGYVKAAQGGIVSLKDGYTFQKGTGILDSNGDYVSVQEFNDGYVVKNNDPLVSFEDNGDNTYWAGDNGSLGGYFQKVYEVNADGSLIALKKRVFDNGTDDRGLKDIYVWRQGVDGNEIGGGNVVVASFDDGRRQFPILNTGPYENNKNAWFKAVDMGSGSSISGNNFQGIAADRSNVYIITSNGEVVNGQKNLLLNRHNFGDDDYLQKNDGSDVYEYTYSITTENGKDYLVMTHNRGDTSKNKKIELAKVDRTAKDVVSVKDEDYNMNLDTVSGGANKAKHSVALNVRGMSLQSYPTQTVFYINENTGQYYTQKWALAPLIYNLNANMLLFSKELTTANTVADYTQAGQAIGYKLRATMQGSDTATNNHTNAKQTSGVLIVSTDKKDSSGVGNRYVGLRHLDALIKAQGEIQVTGGGIALTAKEFLFAFKGELATGTMPSGSQVFNTNDKLAAVEGIIQGDLAAKLSEKNNGLGIDMRIDLADNQKTGMRILTPENTSSIALAKITGRVDADISVKAAANSATANTPLSAGIKIKGNIVTNPTGNFKDDVRIQKIAFNATPLQNTTSKFNPYQDTRIGEFAMTKNTIFTDITIGNVQ